VNVRAAGVADSLNGLAGWASHAIYYGARG
jgi:hypothetical protein